MALLEIRGLTKRFGGLLALNRVDLTLEESMIAALIGPNGAGKTTLFHILTGIYRPDEGEIRFQNMPLIGLTPDRIAAAGIARTFQNVRLFSHMSVLENVLVGMHSRLDQRVRDILFGGRAFSSQESDARNRAREIIRLVGLDGAEWEWAKHLSYGDQRRLEIARALALSPKLLLLDEPTAGMNPAESRSLMALLRKLTGEHVQSILLIEHNMRVVMGISDRVTVLDYGEKIAEGSPTEVKSDLRVIEAYLGRGQWGGSA